MSRQGPRLVSREGRIYIVQEYGRGDPPGTVGRLFYPVGINTSAFERSYGEVPPEGLDAPEYRGPMGSEYRVDRGVHRPLEVRLEHGGKTKAAFVDTRVVLPPKVRPTVELRWDEYYARWEKSSASTKWQWVPAGEGKPPRKKRQSNPMSKQKVARKNNQGRRYEADEWPAFILEGVAESEGVNPAGSNPGPTSSELVGKLQF